ncbi:MAG: Glucans biosynthesis protein [Verrucomicrobiota bacterium]|jgi:Acyltransferase family/Ankyrin repeats (3 copies)
MTPPASSHQRLHDLDALRAAAMLIGIAYHAALSFSIGFPWMVQDVSQDTGAFVFQAWVHGFRMQLFMLVSGFFTAMLWRQKGLKALLWHRCRRVLFPCLLGLITVVPAMGWAVGFAAKTMSSAPPKSIPAEPASANLWSAIRAGDLPAMEGHLAVSGSLTNLHPSFGTTPLTWAALTGKREMAVALLDRGAPVDGRNSDGGTALHAAGFMGYGDVVELLVRRGADVNLPSTSGETPLHSAEQNFDVVRFIAGLLQLPVEEQSWQAGRKQVQEQLKAAGAQSVAGGSGPSGSWAGLWNFLVNQPVFILIWFLWFLVWLIALFAAYAVIAGRLGWQKRPWRFVLSPARLLWLVPLTMVPTWLMGSPFGPDTSMGIVPMPHVLLYYVLFFFFGVFYFDCDDRIGQLGSSWRWSLPITMLVIFPLALEFAYGTLGFRAALLPAPFHKPISVFLQSIFAWGMCVGSMGLFRSLLTRENHTIRYLSDSAYWLYLAHLPLCIAGQAVISQWPVPVWVKWPLFTVVLTAFLLLTYQFLVRYTWVGRLLNGPRTRRAPQTASTAPAGFSAG